MEFFELLILSYVGILGHYFKRAIKATDNDTLKDWFAPGKKRVKELLMLGFSVLSATVIVYIRKNISDIFVVNEVGAICVGFLSQDLLTGIVSLKGPKGVKPIPEDD